MGLLILAHLYIYRNKIMNILDNNQEYSCKLFVDSNLDRTLLGNIIVDFVHGKYADKSSIYNDYLYIFYKINDAADNNLKLDKIDGFLFYQYELEIYSQDNVTFKIYIENLKNLILYGRFRHDGAAIYR